MTRSVIEVATLRFCAIECELQRSGERSVYHMVQGWLYAEDCASTDALPTEDDVLRLGAFIEPVKNEHGYRRVGVRVGWNVKMDPKLVPDAMASLLKGVDDLAPDEWFRQYEEIHPFVDGNGRTGQILFNWLNWSLANPQWAPNFWNDDRRRIGNGVS